MKMNGHVYLDSIDLWDERSEDQLKGWQGKCSMNVDARAIPVV
jgi:hypothetical protein